MSPNPATVDTARCPLCAAPNDCQLCSTATYKGPCWCASVNIPDALLARVPAESRNRACICRACVTQFHREHSGDQPSTLRPGDFYFDMGLMVLTETYLQRRGYCCGSGCRHCPYPARA